MHLQIPGLILLRSHLHVLVQELMQGLSKRHSGGNRFIHTEPRRIDPSKDYFERIQFEKPHILLKFKIIMRFRVKKK